MPLKILLNENGGIELLQLLVIILKKVELVDEMMKQLAEIGVHGGTILEGTGMAKSLANMEEVPMFGMLRHLIENGMERSKVLLFVLRDEQVIQARVSVKNVIDFREANTGIMFSIPITYVEGLGEKN